MGLLPGEDPVEYDKLHKDLIDELGPNGPLECDVVSTIARLLWRKQNLCTFRTAELARQRLNQITRDELARRDLTNAPFDFSLPGTHEYQTARADAEEAAKAQARDELGDRYEHTQSDMVTVERLTADLEVEERLDAAIDKCPKRLLMLRGVKSMAIAPRPEPAVLPKALGANRSAA
jgi:hypothetical protein